MLVIFKFTSNQTGIRKAKDKIKAHLLEMRLYSDSLKISLQAQRNILKANLKYMSYSAKPLLVMIIPVILILIQVNFWFGYQSINTDESFLLTVKLKENYNPMEVDLSLLPSPLFTIETPPVRIEEENEINWRLSFHEPGQHVIAILVSGESIEKNVSIAQKPLSKISPRKVQPSFLKQIEYPVEAPLQKDSPVRSIEIQYLSKGLSLLGMNIHWLIAFFALSIIFGFSLKGFMGVEI